MPALQLLRPDHEERVLAFERANRSYFATFITDRGDDFFNSFPARHAAELAEQAAGAAAYYVLVAVDGAVVGRFNLRFVGAGVAVLGYRVAADAAGQGLAGAAVRDICRLAVADHGVHTIRASTSHENIASTRVLAKAGFVAVRPAEPHEIGGKAGMTYHRIVADAHA